MSVFLAAVKEFTLQLIHLVNLLFSHGLTQRIALPAGKAGEQPREQHDLFLINGNSVCIFQITLHLGNVVGDLFPTMLTRDKCGNIIHRSGTIERIHRDQVFKFGRLQFLQILLHAGRLELKRRDGLSLTEQIVSPFVIDRNLININGLTGRLLDIFDRFFNDRQCFQAKKIHLDQPRFLNDRTFILRNEQSLFRFLVFGRCHRHDIGNILLSDNHTAGMHTCIPHIALQLLSIF